MCKQCTMSDGFQGNKVCIFHDCWAEHENIVAMEGCARAWTQLGSRPAGGPLVAGM